MTKKEDSSLDRRRGGGSRDSQNLASISDHRIAQSSQLERYEYVKSLSAQLADIASANSDSFLAYLLYMASQEANLQKNKIRTAEEISVA